MTWYLIAMVMYAGSTETELKINTALKFRTEEHCLEYRNTYYEGLEQGLKRHWPNITNLEIKCVDEENTLKMQEHMNKRGKT